MNDIILKSDPDFRYNLLARLKSDCEYYLGAGSRYDGHLWSGNPEQQIKDMRALYESFPDEDKPEWITEQQIESFQNQMISANDYNDNITLYVKYQNPINVNGFVVETDTITFGSQEELNKYVSGEAAYDVLDNSVKKRDNEILLYAEKQNGEIVWGAKEIVGVVAFASGETIQYTDKEKYLECIREKLEYSSTSGFKYTTLTNNPEVRKEVDDIAYDLFGENNPYDLEFYKRHININGVLCDKLDEWQKETIRYVLGRDTNTDMEWYMVQARDIQQEPEGICLLEFDRCPDREEVETAHNNLLTEMSINRHEEEYGADGERNFPHLNDPSPTEADYRNIRHRGR